MNVSIRSPGVESYLAALDQEPLLAKLDWTQWLDLGAPFPTTGFRRRDVVERFSRNGFEWDVHGTLYEPDREVEPGVAIVFLHGGAGSEKEFEETPDGRPGLAAIAASLGFRSLAITYPGHYPPGGEWTRSVADRQPVYLLDRTLPDEEISARNMRCTFNVIVEGAARLTDKVLPDHRILAHGHSTGGPMATLLQRFLRSARVVGLLGWASGGPDGWFREWADCVRAKPPRAYELDSVARRTPESFRLAGYVDPPELCPWGAEEGYMRWGDRFKSQMKTGLCNNQHDAVIPALKQYAEITGLPLTEFVDCLWDPDPEWLGRTSVLLLLGENDRNHWFYGETEDDKLESFMGRKFAQRTPRTRIVLLPKYGHFGFVGRHNENIVHAWLWAWQHGFFREP
jgi:pimeloyl-ACP methyl ester carboxylesterase